MMNYKEAIIFNICEKLQLSKRLYEQAMERYDTVTAILQSDKIFDRIQLNVYPHGSFRLKTTVKPLSREEYDLDFVVELPSTESMSPQELYSHIVRILRNDGIHTNMVELKSRCVRIKYKNDFHMDIMPGKQINANTGEIIVPDRDLKMWYHHSNPIGFAKWFENQARTGILREIQALRKAQFSIEPISEQEITERLEPLCRAVQLIKRYRDLYCERTGEEPVRSIVICTLMGHITDFAGDTLGIIHTFCQYVNNLISQSSINKPFDVKNPVVDEVLTEKWHEGHNYQDFVRMMHSLTEDVSKLASLSLNSDINELIRRMFGESVTNEAIKKYAEDYSKVRGNGTLFVNSNGTLNTRGDGVVVSKNTFYG